MSRLQDKKKRGGRYTIRYSALALGLLASLGQLDCSSSSANTSQVAPSSVTLDATPTFNGKLSIAGVVHLPSVLASRAIQLKVMTAPGGTPTFANTVGNVSASSVDYVINGMVAGQYFVEMTVDQNGNGTFGDSGDFDGYYNGDGFGTFKAPTLSQSGATQIHAPAHLPDGGSDPGDNGINFALAVVP